MTQRRCSAINYTVTHLHSDYSLLDSTTRFSDYIARAKELGQTAIASTEHGLPRGWVRKKMACDAAGIKFIHGVEIYLTEALEQRDPETGEMKKVRDNYHTILLAKNLDGVLELNNAVSRSAQPDHFYFTNRMTFDEFLRLSPNIITTSACLASPLNKLPIDHPYYKKLIDRYDFLEIQPHNDPDQKAFNVHLASLAAQYHKPLIVGTDTHSLNAYHRDCRAILTGAKRKSYDDDTFDLTYKSYEELVEMFREQDILPESVYMDAIANTNVAADMCENWTLDTSLKYPILYGSQEEDKKKLVEVTWKNLDKKLADGVIPPEQEQGFRDAINEELRVFEKVQMSGFMLSMSELITWCKENGIPVGPSRGSVGGSRVAYVDNITDLNPEQWHTVFSRFCNEDRVEVGDIDVDVIDTDRPKIFEYIIGRFGQSRTARVPSYGTIKARGVVDEVCRAKMYEWNEAHGLRFDDRTQENPYCYAAADKLKDMLPDDADSAMDNAVKKGTIDEIEWLRELKRKKPDVFQYFDGLWGVKISQSVHPAGMVISPVTLPDNYGTFEKDGDQCLMIDMDEIHDCGLVKYDFLVLSNIGIIRDAFAYAGKPYPKMNEINWNDPKVYEDMVRSPVGIFQFEGDYAMRLLSQFQPKSIFDVTIVTACIRPSGASYRDALISRKPHRNPSKLIDDLLSDNNGYLVYQEDIIKFLQVVCGLTGSEADTVRRGIARKKPEILEAALPKILDGYCSKSPHNREDAEEEAKEFLQIIEDASSYMFGLNHAIGYSLLSYICAYLRCYYPLEFITSYLNHAANDDDIKNGSELAELYRIKILPPQYGESTDIYFFDRDKNVIYKGVGSIRDLNKQVSRDLYELSKTNPTDSFIELLRLIKERTTLRANQLDNLIKVDYFRQYGNIPTLTRMLDLYRFLKEGEAKSFNKDRITPAMAEFIAPYATDVNTKGETLKTYKITDMPGLLKHVEETVLAMDLPDLDIKTKIANQKDMLGYVSEVTGLPEDRTKLIALEVRPLISARTRNPWAYSVNTQSLGTGKQSNMTVEARQFRKHPFAQFDILHTSIRGVSKDHKGYWHLNEYTVERG